jgi:hypothetical protein
MPLLIPLLTVGLSVVCPVDVWVGVLEVPVAPFVAVPPAAFVVAVLGVEAPVFVLGFVAPAAPGATPAVVGVVAGAVVAVVGVVVAAAAVVVTVVVVTGAEPEPPARSTSAAAITPSASTTRTANAATGRFQLGDGARRVRAAEPQRRHQPWSGCRGAPQMGHASPVGDGGGAGSGAPPPCGGDAVALTSRAPEGR